MTAFRYQVWALFLIKVTAALAYGYIFQHGAGDTWGYFSESLQARQLLSAGTSWHFLLPSLHSWSDLLHYAFWTDLRENLFVDLLMLLNLFSGSRYYIDAVLFTGITLAGSARFLRLLRWLYPGNSFLAYLLPFLIPSFLFWDSALHPDAILVCLLFCVLYEIYSLVYIRPTRARLGRLACWIFLITLMKPQLVLLGIPSALAWISIYRWGRRPAAAFGIALGSCLLLVICTGWLPAFNIPGEIASRQALYLQAGGATQFSVPPLAATAGSFLSHLPLAAWIGLAGPPVWELPSSWLLLLETGLCWMLLVACRARRARWTAFESGWILYAVLNLLLIGYTVSNAGAIARYRAMFLPFVFVPFFFPLLRTLSTGNAGQGSQT